MLPEIFHRDGLAAYCPRRAELETLVSEAGESQSRELRGWGLGNKGVTGNLSGGGEWQLVTK